MYLSICQYCWVVKCNLSLCQLHYYLLMASGWHADSWCPAGVIFNSHFFQLLLYLPYFY
jgi:hypothetical protein